MKEEGVLQGPASRGHSHPRNFVNAWLYYCGLTPIFRGVWRLAAEIAAQTLPQRGRVLDYGCGAGGLTQRLVHQGFACTAVEWDAWLLREAGSRLMPTQTACEEDAPVVELVLADTERLALPDASFDLAVSFLGLHGRDQGGRAAMLAELRRLAPWALFIDWQMPERNLEIPAAKASSGLARLVNRLAGSQTACESIAQYYQQGALEGVLYAHRQGMTVECRRSCLGGGLGLALVRWEA